MYGHIKGASDHSVRWAGWICTDMCSLARSACTPPPPLSARLCGMIWLLIARQLLGGHIYTLIEEQRLQDWPVLLPTCDLE